MAKDDMALIMAGPPDGEDEDLMGAEPLDDMGSDGEELTAEQEMLAETMGFDDEKARAFKQFVRSCKEEY